MLVNFRIVILGRLSVDGDRALAEQKIREGLCMSFPMHEAIDDLLIETKPEEGFDDMKERFPS